MDADKRKQEEYPYAYWLCCLPGVGNVTIHRLVESAGSAREVYEDRSLWERVMKPKQLAAALEFTDGWNLWEEYERLRRTGISFVPESGAGYPERLRQIPDRPYGLFVLGSLPGDDLLSVAVIGARECSEYGAYVAGELGRYLGEQGIQVISGMARGIDGISQRAALDAGGVSFGVLGSGVDVCYPRENRSLYDRLRRQGGILSAYPPGTEARPQNFPPRNRIVSGLADALVVIEARSRSGTLITVDMALEQGRDVYVVPGRVTDRLSDGCNRLLKQGAGVFISPEDFLEELEAAWAQKRERRGAGPGCSAGKKSVQRTAEDSVTQKKHEKAADAGIPLIVRKLSPQLRQIYQALDLQPKSIEQIQAGLPEEYSSRQLTVQLMRLCMEGLAAQLTPGHFARIL